MGFEVSASTARKIKHLIGRGQSTGTPKSSTSASDRYDTHVRITGLPTDGVWPCVPTYFDPVAAEWIEFGPALAVASNDGELEVDRRYRAICYGTSGDTLVFAVDEGTPFQPVHVLVNDEMDENGYYPCDVQVWDVTEDAWASVLVDEEAAVCFEPNDRPLVNGTRYQANFYGIDDDVLVYATQAREDLHCGLEFNEDGNENDGKIQINPADIAGDGLKLQEGESSADCDKLQVDPGCGLRIGEDGRLQLDLEAIAYEALRGINDDENGCALSIAYGCHLDLGPDPNEEGAEVLNVTPDTLAGHGLKVQTEVPGDPSPTPLDCPKLQVDPGCGLRIQDNGKLGLDLEAIAYEALRGVNDDESGCSLSVAYGCHLDLGPDPNTEGAEALFVDVSGMAGPGLSVQTEVPGDPSPTPLDCPKLQVNPGCGLRIGEDGRLQLDLEQVAYEALRGVNDDVNGCSLSIAYGCHLDLGPDPNEEGAEVLNVTPNTLAGPGLTVTGEDCQQIAFPLDPQTGPAFSAITSISFTDCKLKYTVTPFNFTQNADGVLLGFEAGEGVEHEIAASQWCDCCGASYNCGEDGNCYDPGDGSGTYSSLSECEENCGTNESYNCGEDGNCYDPGDGTGTYATLSECDENCGTNESYNCGEDGNCYDPGDGTGTYGTLAECEENCSPPESYNCGENGECTDPGDGTGEYSSLFDCESNCISQSYNCGEDGNCYDPGDGTGTYSSLFDCNENCGPGYNCGENGNCYFIGDGTGTYATLLDCEANCSAPESYNCGENGECTDPGDGTGAYSTLFDCESNCGGTGEGGFAMRTTAPEKKKDCGCKKKARLANPNRVKKLIDQAKKQGFGK